MNMGVFDEYNAEKQRNAANYDKNVKPGWGIDKLRKLFQRGEVSLSISPETRKTQVKAALEAAHNPDAYIPSGQEKPGVKDMVKYRILSNTVDVYQQIGTMRHGGEVKDRRETIQINPADLDPKEMLFQSYSIKSEIDTVLLKDENLAFLLSEKSLNDKNIDAKQKKKVIRHVSSLYKRLSLPLERGFSQSEDYDKKLEAQKQKLSSLKKLLDTALVRVQDSEIRNEITLVMSEMDRIDGNGELKVYNQEMRSRAVHKLAEVPGKWAEMSSVAKKALLDGFKPSPYDLVPLSKLLEVAEDYESSRLILMAISSATDTALPNSDYSIMVSQRIDGGKTKSTRLHPGEAGQGLSMALQEARNFEVMQAIEKMVNVPRSGDVLPALENLINSGIADLNEVIKVIAEKGSPELVKEFKARISRINLTKNVRDYRPAHRLESMNARELMTPLHSAITERLQLFSDYANVQDVFSDQNTEAVLALIKIYKNVKKQSGSTGSEGYSFSTFIKKVRGNANSTSQAPWFGGVNESYIFTKSTRKNAEKIADALEDLNKRK